MTDLPDRSTNRGNAAERIAVALEYALGREEAPSVVASGRGELAGRIIEIAEANSVPVRSDVDLARLLSAMKVGDQIPPPAFAAVAEILAYLYRLDSRLAGDAGRTGGQAGAQQGHAP